MKLFELLLWTFLICGTVIAIITPEKAKGDNWGFLVCLVALGWMIVFVSHLDKIIEILNSEI